MPFASDKITLQMKDLVMKRQNRHRKRLVRPEYQAEFNENLAPFPNAHYETQDVLMCASPKGHHPFYLRIIHM